jgi:hypothetical protein
MKRTTKLAISIAGFVSFFNLGKEAAKVRRIFVILPSLRIGRSDV